MQSRAASVRSSRTAAPHGARLRALVVRAAAAPPRLYTNPGSRGKLVEWVSRRPTWGALGLQQS